VYSLINKGFGQEERPHPLCEKRCFFPFGLLTVRREGIVSIDIIQSDFVTPKEAADILDITRQALHKHHRIQKGFIYSIVIGGRKLFNRVSVQLFKETGDGRFNLITENSVHQNEGMKACV
jgi:hypothetical protein